MFVQTCTWRCLDHRTAGDGQLLLARVTAQFIDRPPDLLKSGDNRMIEAAPVGGQGDPAALAFKEPGTELRLKARNVAVHRRLRGAKLFCRTRKITVARGALESR